MIAYVGQCRGRRLNRKLQFLGIGEMTCRGEMPPRRYPWALDNGAFRDYAADPPRPFDGALWLSELEWARLMPSPPEFVVAPDIVGGGMDSLAESIAWLPRLRPFRVYLALQDGMTPDLIRDQLSGFAGLFLGGTREWKVATLIGWANFAKSLGLPLHVGRASSPSLVEICYQAGADSIDSSQPLWSKDHMRRWLSALPSIQPRLFPAATTSP